MSVAGSQTAAQPGLDARRAPRSGGAPTGDSSILALLPLDHLFDSALEARHATSLAHFQRKLGVTGITESL